MAANLGFSALLLVLTIGIFLPFFNFFSYKKYGLKDLAKTNSLLIAALFLAAICSQFSLIYSFVISDYSVANVYQNSHHLKPLIYKISGSWGNHEGSMLLLISILCCYSFSFNFLSKIEVKAKLIINSTQAFIIANFAAFTALTSNPFERIFPTPTSGLELNPLLQDIGLSLHPPMLYAGYIGFALVFSFIIAALLLEKLDKNLIQKLRPFLFFSYAFLTVGIALGSWWAYRELGWGGYWFWDPVENISLMPWLCATALIHSLRLSETKETSKNWSCFLAIFTFILCLLGIFLTRSGILTSVHSFAIDASRGFFIIALIFMIGGSSLLIFGAKINKITSKTLAKSKKVFSPQNLIFINNYFLIFALLVVLLGTLYPIFSRGFFNEFTSIGAPYYNQIFSILIIPFLVTNRLFY
jgi:cytochrome c-type biogenesis protein CcmF